MYGYYSEKIDFGHYWDLNGQEWLSSLAFGLF